MKLNEPPNGAVTVNAQTIVGPWLKNFISADTKLLVFTDRTYDLHGNPVSWLTVAVKGAPLHSFCLN